MKNVNMINNFCQRDEALYNLLLMDVNSTIHAVKSTYLLFMVYIRKNGRIIVHCIQLYDHFFIYFIYTTIATDQLTKNLQKIIYS